MDEQTYQMLIELGALGDEDNELSKQLEFARALRMNERPLEGTQAGRVFVANNPLQHLAGMLERQRNNRDMRDILGQKGEIRGKQTEARGRYGKMIPGMTPPINPYEMSLYGNDPSKDYGVL